MEKIANLKTGDINAAQGVLTTADLSSPGSVHHPAIPVGRIIHSCAKEAAWPALDIRDDRRFITTA